MPIVYESRVFAVEAGRHRFPNGEDYDVAIVRHRPSVALIPVPNPGSVILIRQYRASVGRELWEIPAGGVRAGEQPDEAAIRECEEEVGLRPATIERIHALLPAPGFCDEELIFYRVSDLRLPPPDTPHRPDEDEHFQVKSFSIAHARAMVGRGDIVDLKTAYGLLLI